MPSRPSSGSLPALASSSLLLSSLLLLVPAAAPAQAFDTRAAFWEVTPQAGFLAPEEPEGSEIEAGPLFSARVGYRRAAGFGVEAHAAFAPLDMDVAGNPPEEIDLPALLYGADVVYAWSISPRSDFFVSAGFGGITWFPDSEGSDEDAETDPRATFGAGIHYLIASGIGLRGDVRDHVIFDQLSDLARSLGLADRGNTNNLEGSVGVTFVLP